MPVTLLMLSHSVVHIRDATTHRTGAGFVLVQEAPEYPEGNPNENALYIDL